MGENHMFIVEFHPEHGVGQQLSDHATEFDHIFLGQ
jgi:hypothetical protein